MHVIKRKLYKRGSSYEVTIPMPILFGLDLDSKHNLYFYNKDKHWFIQIDEKPKTKQFTSRSIYKRGSSYETTIPLPLILHLDTKKHYNVLFNFEQSWYIDFEVAGRA